MKIMLVLFSILSGAVNSYAAGFDLFRCEGFSTGWSGGGTYTYNAKFDVDQLKSLTSPQQIAYQVQYKDGAWQEKKDYFEGKNSSGVLIFRDQYIEVRISNNITTLIIDRYVSSGSGGSTHYQEVCRPQ